MFASNRNGESCLAQLEEDKRWYRASTQNKVSGDAYNLLYIDYGNMEEVPADRIREMRQEFIFPCITVMCFIDGKSNRISRIDLDTNEIAIDCLLITLFYSHRLK